MNHDELLAEIKSLNDSCSVSSRLGNALKAVMGVHTTSYADNGCSCCEGYWTCNGCGETNDEDSICPTLEAIEKELK